MSTTPKYGLRYPVSTAAPNVPQDIQNLATDVDNSLSAVAATVPKIIGYADGTTNQSFTGAGIASYMRVIVTLQTGRLYKATAMGTLQNNTVNGQCTWNVLGAAGVNATVNGNQAVCSLRTVHVLTGGPGSQTITGVGYFVATQNASYCFDSWVIPNSGTTATIGADARGRYDFVLEDCGPNPYGTILGI